MDFAAVNNLCIMNTFFQHRASQKWTWYRFNHQQQCYTQRSMIDLFLTNNSRLFSDVKAIPSLSMHADHRLIIAKVRMQRPKRQKQIGSQRFKLRKLEDQNNVTELREAISTKLRENSLSAEEMDADSLWNNFKDITTQAAREILGEKQPYLGKKKMTPWWNDEVREAVKKKMKSFRIWMKTRTPQSRQEYVLARSEAERVKRLSKQQCWIKIGEDLATDHQGNRKLLYSLAKSYRKKTAEGTFAIKDKNGNLLTETDEIAERWKEYFSELLNVGDENNLRENDINLDIHEGLNNEPITIEEIKNEIGKMKRGKSPGEDCLPVEILRAGGDVVVEKLYEICHLAYQTEKIPEDWRKGVIRPIQKKGDKTVCDNHRGITLLSHAGKIFTRILETRLRAIVEETLNDCQYGFRPGRSTTDPIFIMKMLLEKSWEWGIDQYALFIDLEKAFDRIDRSKLWNILADNYYNIPHKLIRVIRSVYRDCTSVVKTQGIESATFPIETGVRQGDVLSPLLFIIFMDKCIRDVGIGIHGEETLMYADDVAVLLDSPGSLQEVANRWWEGMERNGMRINTRKDKTEIVMISRNAQQCNVYMGADKLNQVDNYSHLGVNVGSANLQEVEIKSRIAKYNRNVGMMHPLLRDVHIPRKCKIIIYQSILKPILLYGSEVWSLTSKTESQLQAAEMRVLRTIRGVTRRDRMRNSQIRAELQVVPLLEDIERNKLRWYGHVMRMTDDRKPKKYLQWRPAGRRPVGRPRRRWIEGVGSALTARGTSLGEVEESRRYEDRGEWRSFLRSSPADR